MRWGLTVVGIVALAASCGGKAVVDEVATSIGTTTTTSTTTSSRCISCGTYIFQCRMTTCPDAETVCPGEQEEMLERYRSCVCEACADVCMDTCGEGHDLEPACFECVRDTDACADPFGACMAD